MTESFLSDPNGESDSLSDGVEQGPDFLEATEELLEQTENSELPPEVKDKHPTTIAEAFSFAAPKPVISVATGPKIAYATRLSALVAKALRFDMLTKEPKLFRGLRAGEDPVGKGTTASKKIDLLLATDREGMKMNISIKTQSFRDYQTKQVKETKA